MGNYANQQLNDIKWKVDRIINDLGGIANGLDYDFDNVGNEIVAQKIWHVHDRFKEVRRSLNQINMTNIDES